MNSLINGIILYGIFQAFFLGFILLIKHQKIPAVIFLSILLFIEAIGLSEQGLYFSGQLYTFPFLLGVSYPLTVLRPLLIYFFSKAYFQHSFKPKKSDLLHLISFVLFLLLFLPLITSSPEEKVIYLDQIKDNIWSDNIDGIIFFIVNNAIYSVYYFFTWKIIRSAKPEIKLERNGQSIRIANFVTFLLGFFIIKQALYILNGFHLMSNESFGTIVMLISSFTIQFIAWFIISNSKLPSFNPTNPSLKKETSTLKKVLEIDKIYLEDDLTLKRLSIKCDIPQDRLTDLFWLEYQCAFKEVVNNLRIREAKELIESELNGKHMNLLGIAMDSGFNNKVTFYRAFKKSAGMAPSEYVKQRKSTSENHH